MSSFRDVRLADKDVEEKRRIAAEIERIDRDPNLDPDERDRALASAILPGADPAQPPTPATQAQSDVLADIVAQQERGELDPAAARRAFMTADVQGGEPSQQGTPVPQPELEPLVSTEDVFAPQQPLISTGDVFKDPGFRQAAAETRADIGAIGEARDVAREEARGIAQERSQLVERQAQQREKASKQMFGAIQSEAELLRSVGELRGMDQGIQNAKKRYQEAQQDFFKVGQDEKSKRRERFLKSKQRKVEVGNAIGLMFGAIAAAKLGGGPNPVAKAAELSQQMIDKQIDDEFDRQDRLRSDARTKAALRGSELEAAEERFSDKMSRELAARGLIRQGYIQRLKSLAQNVTDQDAALAIQQQAAQQEDKALAGEQQLAMAEGQLQQQSLQREADIASQNVRAQQAQVEQAQQAAQAPELAVGFELEPGRRPPPQKSLEDFNESVVLFSDLNNVMTQIEDLRSQGTGEALRGKLTGKLSALTKQLKLGTKEYLNLGAAFTETEEALIDGAIGPDDAILLLNKQFQTFAKTARSGLQSKAKLLGLRATPETARTFRLERDDPRIEPEE